MKADVNRIFKYSVVALQNPEGEDTREIIFEDTTVIKQHDHLVFNIDHRPMLFEVEAVKKVDHVLTPNDEFDYRIFVVGI